MAATITRAQARARLMDITLAIVNRVIPEDEAVPLDARTLLDFERKADAFDELKCAAIEAQCGLSDASRCDSAGRCPHCGSDDTRLKGGPLGESKAEARSPCGMISYDKQHARCRACEGSFSPSAQGLGAAKGRRADAQGPRAGLPRMRRPAL